MKQYKSSLSVMAGLKPKNIQNQTKSEALILIYLPIIGYQLRRKGKHIYVGGEENDESESRSGSCESSGKADGNSNSSRSGGLSGNSAESQSMTGGSRLRPDWARNEPCDNSSVSAPTASAILTSEDCPFSSAHRQASSSPAPSSPPGTLS